jgi:glyoxylase-like metal-dependent hydrolase (beta-lactamase superfamily II)
LSAVAGPVAIERIPVGPLEANCYVVEHARGGAVVVDPGDEHERISAYLDERSLSPDAIVATHGHYDHIGAAAVLAERYRAPFHVHPADAPLLLRLNFYRSICHGQASVPIPALDVTLADGDELALGALRVRVLHTPGHTEGSICLAAGNELFSGDTLAHGKPGRTDLPGGDAEALERSLARLAAQHGPDTPLRPGHGPSARLGDLLGARAGRPA